MHLGRAKLVAVLGTSLGAVLIGSNKPAEAQMPAAVEIRVSPSNRVPGCVTPERLMQHLKSRNPTLHPRFEEIADLYKKHGEAHRIRWDYAFYQMILETNYLKFGGDVKAHQNNFAGVGATGGGVRGNGFPDVSTGVLAQIQHLVAYSGERVDKPVAKRTQEVQEYVIAKSLKLGRPVRYSDLTNRWAADRKYARSMELIADRFRSDFCSRAAIAAASVAPAAAPTTSTEPSRTAAAAQATQPQALARSAIALSRKEPGRAALGVKPIGCVVMTASYGDASSVLIRVADQKQVTYTALGVASGQEQAMAEAFIAAHAAGGSIAGRFRTRDDAVAKAWHNCDSGQP